MSEPGGGEITETGNSFATVELYRSTDYVSLYRYENPTVPYDESREGVVSKADLVGNWYTNSLDQLRTYTTQRIQGQRGGRFVVVRIRKDVLDKYDATKLPETREMDIENGNYLIPPEVGAESRVEVEALFKDEWEGMKHVPFKDRAEIGTYIQQNLSDEALIKRLEGEQDY